MYRFKSTSLLAAGVLLAVAGAAGAATKTSSFVVTASVADNCVIATNDVNFGAFDGLTDLTQSADITIRCTTNTPYEVELSTGGSGDYAAREMASGGDVLVYNLYTDGGHTNIWGDGTTAGTGSASGTGTGMAFAQTKTHTVYGELLAADNADAPVGNYSDSITATVIY